MSWLIEPVFFMTGGSGLPPAPAPLVGWMTLLCLGERMTLRGSGCIRRGNEVNDAMLNALPLVSAAPLPGCAIE